MRLKITGRHLVVTPAIQEYVHTKLERVFRHFGNVTRASLILSLDHLIQHAEITVHVPGKEIFVEASDVDMYAAIDSLLDKLDRQVIKFKQKAYTPSHDTIKYHTFTE